MASLDKDNTIADLDLILKGGTVIDPAQGIHQNKDVALKDGRIAALKDRIDEDCFRDVFMPFYSKYQLLSVARPPASTGMLKSHGVRRAVA